MDKSEVKDLEAIVSQVQITAGQTLFCEGEDADHLYNVTRGAVRVFKLLADGRRQITGFMLPGDFLGLSVRDGYAYGAEAVVTTDLCRFPVQSLMALFERYPKLEKKLLQLAGDELAAAQEQMLLLGRKTPMEKVASFLIMLAMREAKFGLPPDLVSLPMSRSDIADYLGLTVETVSRTFSRLKNGGVIRLHDSHHVEVKRIDDMHELADGA